MTQAWVRKLKEPTPWISLFNGESQFPGLSSLRSRVTWGLKAQTLELDSQVPSLVSASVMLSVFSLVFTTFMPHTAGKAPLLENVLGGNLALYQLHFCSRAPLPKDPSDCRVLLTDSPFPFLWPVPPSDVWPLLLSSILWACVAIRLPHTVCLSPSWMGRPSQ